MCNERLNGSHDLNEAKACGSKVNKVHKPWHIVMFIQSLEPGVGCFWNACCCHSEDVGCVFGNIINGYWMALTSVCIIGWLNSVIFGISIYRKSE